MGLASASEREVAQLFFSASDGESHGVAIHLPGIGDGSGLRVLIAKHWASVLRREGSRGFEITPLVDLDRLGDFAVGAIELNFGAVFRDFQHDVVARPSTFCHRFLAGRSTGVGLQQDGDDSQSQRKLEGCNVGYLLYRQHSRPSVSNGSEDTVSTGENPLLV